MFKQARQSRCCCGKAIALVTLLSLVLAGGCAAWDAERWSIDRLRDERSLDIEQRLSRDKPIVQSPFSKTEAEDE